MPRIGQQSYWLKRWIKNKDKGAALPCCAEMPRLQQESRLARGEPEGKHATAVSPLTWSQHMAEAWGDLRAALF